MDTEDDLNWRIAGAADFNGDGKPDLLWSNAVTGANVLGYLDGLVKVGTAPLETVLAPDSTTVDLNWQIQSAGVADTWALDPVLKIRIFHRLADNDDISRDEYAKLRARLLDDDHGPPLRARDYIARHDLSPAVFLPGKIWAAISDYLAAPAWTYDMVIGSGRSRRSPATKR